MGLLTITSGSMQEHSSVSLSVIGNSTGSSAKPSDISFSTDGGVLWRSGSSLVTSLLAKLGTVTTGTWNATTIGVAYGGTGQTTYTNGQFLIGQTSGNTLAKFVISGDITINNSGVATIANSVVSDSKLSSTYALLAGRSSGQILSGGTASSETLTLRGTSHATAGKVLFGDGVNYHDDTNRYFYIRPYPYSITNNFTHGGGEAIVIESSDIASIEFVGSTSSNHSIQWYATSGSTANIGTIAYHHPDATLALYSGERSTGNFVRLSMLKDYARFENAHLQIINNDTNQLIIGYNDTNYLGINVASGGVTFDITGLSNPGFIFNQKAKFLTAFFNSEVDNGNSGTTKTIDWTAGNNQKVTMTGNCTFTFTAPPGISHITLKVIQDATGSRTITWPATVKWAGGTKPTQTTTASAVDIMVFYYDGTNYHGAMASADSK